MAQSKQAQIRLTNYSSITGLNRLTAYGSNVESNRRYYSYPTSYKRILTTIAGASKSDRKLFSYPKASFHTSKPLMKQSYYELLGVGKSASKDDIKKAYRTLAMKYHPDRNPDPASQEKFKQITEAYSVLSDDSKRQTYDQFGEEAVNSGFGGMGGMSAEEIFAQMFGGGFGGGDGRGGFPGGFDFGDMEGMPFGGRQREKRTEDMEHVIQLSLEDVYNGKQSVFEYNRRILCGTCHGTGAKPPHKPTKCTSCKGTGQRVVTRQLGGMITQSIGECPSCHGEGEVVASNHKCTDCHGSKVTTAPHRIHVNIPRGVKNGDVFNFAGEAHQFPGATTGDVRVYVDVKPHPIFKRLKGDDLLMEQTIPLANALSGFEFNIPTLDRRNILVRETFGKPGGKIIKPGTVMLVHNEGLPNRNGKKGNLYIRFKIEFPEGPLLNPDALSSLSSATKQSLNIPTGPPPAGANTVPLSEAYSIPPEEDPVDHQRARTKRSSGNKGQRSAGPEQPQCSPM